MYLLLTGVFGTALTGTMLAYQAIFGERIKMAKRVDAVVGGSAPVPIRQQELSAPLYQRAVKPVLTGLGRILAKNIPAAREATLAKKLNEAGNPGNLSPRELMVIKYIFAAGSGLALWFMCESAGSGIVQCVMQAAVGFVFGWQIPDVVLNSKIRHRKDEVERSLPDVLDLLTVSVEAGLGFDGAMMKVVEKSEGVLAEGFLEVLQESKMGKPRREALRDMAERLAVDDLSNFVGSVIMADQLGISIGNVLRLQSKDIREKRRQRVEEMAMKAPVKMLIPMVMFIFPAIFIVLLGPAIIQIMHTFG
jgi:tight adherence protein C